LIEGVIRIVGCAGYKSGGEGQLSSGNLRYFVLCELASTHPVEYTVCIIVRHRFSPFSVFDFLLQTPWENPRSKQNMDQERLQNKAFWFNLVPKWNSALSQKDVAADFRR
jgi:hypothetical protein